MAKPRIQSRVDPSQKQRVENYAEKNDMTQAEAVRYLTLRGLDYESGVLSDAGGGPDVGKQQEYERPDTYRGWLFVALGFTAAGLKALAEWLATPTAFVSFVVVGAAWGAAGAAGLRGVAVFAGAWYVVSGVARLLLRGLSSPTTEADPSPDV